MSADTFHDGRVTLHGGDCLDVMAGMEAESVDAIVTDPPYELGFMGRAWDKSGIAFESATWAAALREGFRAVLIEREEEYRADIARRMAHAFDGEDGRKRAIVKARGHADYSAGPLFGHGEAAE